MAEPALIRTFAALPATKRGYGFNLNVSPKDDRIVYANGRAIFLRSITNPADTIIFTEHKCNATVASFAPNGNWVASGDEEGNVIVWSYPQMKVKNTVKVGKSILDIDWDAESTRIVAVGDGAAGKAKVFTWDSGNNIGEIAMHNNPILSCSYRKQRPFRIATGSEDLTVNWYEGPPFKYVKAHKGHSRYPNCVRFSPDGNSLISVGADSKIVMYDGKTGDQVKEFECKENHTGAIYAFSWSPDSKRILTASADRTAKIWDVESGEVVSTWKFGDDVSNQQVAALWYKDYLLTVSLSGAINYLDLANPGQLKKVVVGHQHNITSLDVDRKNGFLYTSATNGEICRWDYATGETQWMSGKNPGKFISAISLNASAMQLLSFGFDDRVRVNNLSSFDFAADSTELGGQPAVAAASPKNDGLAVAGLAQNKLVVIHNGQVASSLDVDYTPTAIAFNHDGSRVLVGGKDNKFHVYVLAGSSLTQVAVQTQHDKPITSIAASADGRLLVGADRETSIYIRDAKSLEVYNPSGWRYHQACIQSVAFNNSSNRFATGALDSNIFIWNDLQKFEPERQKITHAHPDQVDFVAWWDDNTLVSVGNKFIRFWKV